MESIAKRAAAILAALVGLVILTVTLVGFNWLRGPVSWAVSRAIGRTFEIRGDLRVHLGRTPRITADRLVLANAPWGTMPEMVDVQRLGLTIDVGQLVRGHVVLPEIDITRPSVLLERSDTGEGNWPAASEGASTGRRPSFGRVRLDGGRVRYRDPVAGTEIEAELTTPRPATPDEQVVDVQARGQVAGRPFSVRNVQARLTDEVALTAEGIILANAPWGSRPVMVAIDRAATRLDLASLLTGEVRVRELQLSDPKVLLETSSDGKRRNWTLATTATPRAAEPARAAPSGAPGAMDPAVAGVLAHLEIKNGTFTYRDPPTNTDVTVTVDRVGPSRPGATPTMGVTGRGRYLGASFALSGKVGTILAIQDVRVPYPIDVAVKVADTQATLRGTLMAPLELRGLNVDLALEGSDLSKLYPFIPVPLPETPPYKLAGRLERVGQAWTFSGFQGQVGQSDLAGDFGVDLGGQRPRLTGDLVSHSLDFKDLGPLVGAPPGAQGPASPEQRQRAAAQAKRDRVLPDQPFRLERLQAADADVSFRGERLVGTGLPLESLSAHVRLEDGRLQLEPFNVGMAGGTVSGTLLMDARRQPLETAADVAVRDLDLNRLFPGFKLGQASAGLIGGAGRFGTSGNAVAEMLGSMTGDVALTMEGGQVSKLLLDLADLDVAGSALRFMGGDQAIPVRCLVADFHADDGRMKAQTLVLESTDTRIEGAGTIDFKDEGLDLRLAARSKRPSLVALRGPIHLGGRFKSPSVRPDPTQPVLRAVAAAALGFVTPPAAILPFLELGVTKDVDCGALVAGASERVRIAGPPPNGAGRAGRAEAPRAATPGRPPDNPPYARAP
jgi:AsmA family protein